MKKDRKKISFEKQNIYVGIDVLETVPGIGRLTAIKFLLQIGPIDRFNTLEGFCNYIGLVPATLNSGEYTQQNRITRQGHTQLRVMMIEAAWVAIGVDPCRQP